MNSDPLSIPEPDAERIGACTNRSTVWHHLAVGALAFSTLLASAGAEGQAVVQPGSGNVVSGSGSKTGPFLMPPAARGPMVVMPGSDGAMGKSSPVIVQGFYNWKEVSLCTQTNTVFLEFEQAAKEADLERITGLMPKIEELWAESPDVYIEILRTAASWAEERTTITVRPDDFEASIKLEPKNIELWRNLYEYALQRALEVMACEGERPILHRSTESPSRCIHVPRSEGVDAAVSASSCGIRRPAASGYGSAGRSGCDPRVPPFALRQQSIQNCLGQQSCAPS